MKKKIYYLTGIVIVTLFTILLWPLSSSEFNIEVDQDRVEFKANFLDEIKEGSSIDSPNILLIVVDDLGMDDLSLYGRGYPNTPNIDKLGKSGVVFSNAYVTSPVCSPSRAALLTGRYQQRFGFQTIVHERYLKNRLEYLGFKYFVNGYQWKPRWMKSVPTQAAIANQGMPPSEILLSELLKNKGYETAIIGKWHLGYSKLRIPCNFGFDYQYGFYSSHSLYAYENTPGIHDQKVENEFTDPHIWSNQRDGSHAIFRNCEEVEVKDYLTDNFTDEAIDYLKKERKKPFFLYLPYSAPHTPFQAPDDYMEKFGHIEDPIKRTYHAMIANLDDNIGRLLSTLEKSGQAENTIVFFISDNGGAEYTRATENGQYLGGKLTDFEGGSRVPFIMSWKNHLMAGRFEPMVSSMDIFQTIVEILKIPLPEDRIYDGVNLMPYLTGSAADVPHDYLFWQKGFSKSVRGNRWKLMLNEDAADTVLFDLINDSYESTELTNLHMEIARQLAKVHQNWSKDLPQPLWPSMIDFEFINGNKRYYFEL